MSDTIPKHHPEEPVGPRRPAAPEDSAAPEATEIPETGEDSADQGEDSGASGKPDAAGQRRAAPEPAAPAPLGVERAPTGDAGVDAGLARLGDVDHLATDGHIEVYEDVHQALREALTALDARPATPAHDHRS
ncbi:hypothetical protein [Streptomyces sp. 8L]|uniref:hypothetical protein n=1 Tax=Streptomyces sp. 8L TaxID=2877242 RepID=UPI0021E52EAA